MANTTRIGIIGDFNPENPTHIATNRGIEHAGQSLGRHFEAIWLPPINRRSLDDSTDCFAVRAVRTKVSMARCWAFNTREKTGSRLLAPAAVRSTS